MPWVLLFLPAHLHFKALGILDVETAFSRADLQTTALQFGFDLRLNSFIRVPVRDRVGDMINLSRGLPVANNEDVIAKRQTALHSVISRYLHPKQARVKVADLFVI